MPAVIKTRRIELRPWRESDAEAALSIYGAPDVRRWLGSQLASVVDAASMAAMIRRWKTTDRSTPSPEGHWAITLSPHGSVIGGITLARVPTPDGSVTLHAELSRSAWGHGFAAEAGDALIHWAMHEAAVLDVFALVPPGHVRGASTAERMGMQWIYDLGNGLRVYRIRHGDLACPDPVA